MKIKSDFLTNLVVRLSYDLSNECFSHHQTCLSDIKVFGDMLPHQDQRCQLVEFNTRLCKSGISNWPQVGKNFDMSCGIFPVIMHGLRSL